MSSRDFQHQIDYLQMFWMNGGYFINSAFLLGLATFFYAVTMTYGVIALVLETAIYLLLCKVIKTHVTDSAKQ